MNWIKGLFMPLRRVEIRIANDSLEWAYGKGKDVQEAMYQQRQAPLLSPHCYQHTPPVPLHRTGIDTYACLFCRAERQERNGGTLASAVYEQPERHTDQQRQYVPQIRTQQMSIPPHVQQRKTGQP